MFTKQKFGLFLYIKQKKSWSLNLKNLYKSSDDDDDS